MKAIYRIIIAIFAAAALAVSCSKDAVPEGGAQVETGEVRVITLSFGGSTKAALDDFTPKFSDGDRVMLSNGTRTEECTVSVAGGKATVTTTLTGVLNAVSPASAAVTDGGDLTYRIPVTQSGRFSDAAIATAQNIISAAELEIQVSLLKFYVDESISVHSITVESTQNIATAGSSNLKQITVGSGASYLHIVTDDPQNRLCYAAVLPGIPASSLKFTSDTESQGIVRRQSPASTVTLAKNTLYKAFIPYYIKFKVSSAPDVYQRWGYCNVGAFLPEEPGKYFAWGDTDGQTWDGSAWSNGGFSTAPDVGTPVPSELPLQLDAAYVNWGGTWRMHTKQDFINLDIACGGNGNNNQHNITPISKTSHIEDGKVKKGRYWLAANQTELSDIDELKSITAAGMLCSDGENYLFFPAVGSGSGTSFNDAGSVGRYWGCTSSPDTDKAYGWTFNINVVNSYDSRVRYLGFSIRPIFDNSLTMEDYDDGGDI